MRGEMRAIVFAFASAGIASAACNAVIGIDDYVYRPSAQSAGATGGAGPATSTTGPSTTATVTGSGSGGAGGSRGFGGCWAQLALGQDHTCGRTKKGELWCWGSNSVGQLGIGTYDPFKATPQSVGALSNIVVVVAAGLNSCARVDQGYTWCWGSTANGQLGDGETGNFNKVFPVPIGALGTSAFAFAMGAGEHNCAVLADHAQLLCWGHNQFGEIGDGTTEIRPMPVGVVGIGQVLAAAAGTDHTCALDEAGGAWCWGDGAFGEIGAGDATDREVPVRVLLGNPGNAVMQVAAGGHFSCAVMQDTSVWCWGANDRGQLGVSSPDSCPGAPACSKNPIQIPSFTAVAEISIGAGASYTCARKQDGTVWCWGANDHGQLGNGTTTDSQTPVQVNLMGADVAKIACGGAHACAFKADGSAWCWGANHHGQLGDGATIDRSLPAQLACPPE